MRIQHLKFRIQDYKGESIDACRENFISSSRTRLPDGQVHEYFLKPTPPCGHPSGGGEDFMINSFILIDQKPGVKIRLLIFLPAGAGDDV
jgi:hypothetical protein